MRGIAAASLRVARDRHNAPRTAGSYRGPVTAGDIPEHVRESGLRAESLDEGGAAVATPSAAAIAGDAHGIEAAGCEGEGAFHAGKLGQGRRECKKSARDCSTRGNPWKLVCACGVTSFAARCDMGFGVRHRSI